MHRVYDFYTELVEVVVLILPQLPNKINRGPKHVIKFLLKITEKSENAYISFWEIVF